MLLTEYVFWLAVSTIGYIYIGYPVALFICGKCFPKNINKRHFQPTITILIAAFNEEQCIRETIENKFQMDYPKEKLEIIVVSDGSTDRTDEIVKGLNEKGVRLLRQEPRSGKTLALSLAAKEARGEILAFSDANSIYEKDALSHLVRNFSDPEVGYVTGRMVYVNTDGNGVGDGCSAYMKFENLLRQYETKVGSIVGVDGGIDMVRRSLFQPMRMDQLPDFVLPLKVIEKGFRVVYEPLAILREATLKDSEDEYKMRVRVSLRALWAIKDMKALLNVFKYGIFSVQLFSHKVLRYLAFLFLSLLYLSNLLLLSQGVIYQVMFILQNVFYLGSLWGYHRGRKGNIPPVFKLPYYFCLINLAASHAFLKFIKGTKQVIWTPRTG